MCPDDVFLVPVVTCFSAVVIRLIAGALVVTRSPLAIRPRVEAFGPRQCDPGREGQYVGWASVLC